LKAMGLCKCPKKNMTSLFCYEHRVNVCEHCLLDNHANCVVQTYLQWLSDSDFDPNCTLCSSPMNNGDAPTVRLQCFHVYHWGCVDEWARRLPANTAPAGYRCPQCQTAVFPKPNQTSLLIERLRATLAEANWARAGLGMQLSAEYDRPVAAPPALVAAKAAAAASPAPSTHAAAHNHAAPPAVGNYRASTPATVLSMDDGGVEYAGPIASRNEIGVRKKYGESCEDTRPLLTNDSYRDADEGANKYARRPPMEWARGLWRAKYGDGGAARDEGPSGWRKMVFIGFLMLLVLATVFMVLSRIMSRPGDDDPLYDPMSNPNIRVAAEESRAFH
ncbi:hypothetical protein PFISCL1PPCAC_1040, partial [Pristionchus fissidentatus]